jgi:hypothetical protein
MRLCERNAGTVVGVQLAYPTPTTKRSFRHGRECTGHGNPARYLILKHLQPFPLHGAPADSGYAAKCSMMNSVQTDKASAPNPEELLLAFDC